jgi:hypothetical protein
MNTAHFESCAIGVIEFINAYIKQHVNIGSEICGIREIEQCARHIMDVNDDLAIKALHSAKSQKLEISKHLADIMKPDEKNDGKKYICIHIKSTGEYIKTTKRDHIMNMIGQIPVSMDSKQCVNLQFVFRETDPIYMSFQYQGNDIGELQETIRSIQGDTDLTYFDSTIVIKELSENYRDYVHKLQRLLRHPKMQKFASHIRKLEVEYPEGVDFNIIKVPIDPIDFLLSVNHPIMNITFNIIDNRTINYNHCFINSGGGNMTVQQVSEATGVDKEKMDMCYLKWVSENPPMLGEHKSVYYRRMKNDNPKFIGGPRVNNKYMDALGWKDNRSHTGHRVWMKI